MTGIITSRSKPKTLLRKSTSVNKTGYGVLILRFRKTVVRGEGEDPLPGLDRNMERWGRGMGQARNRWPVCMEIEYLNAIMKNKNPRLSPLALWAKKGLYGPGRRSRVFLSLSFSIFLNAHGFESLFPLKNSRWTFLLGGDYVSLFLGAGQIFPPLIPF